MLKTPIGIDPKLAGTCIYEHEIEKIPEISLSGEIKMLDARIVELEVVGRYLEAQKGSKKAKNNP